MARGEIGVGGGFDNKGDGEGKGVFYEFLCVCESVVLTWFLLETCYFLFPLKNFISLFYIVSIFVCNYSIQFNSFNSIQFSLTA